jgi:hypothetical protein
VQNVMNDLIDHFNATNEAALVDALLGERCDWSDLPSNTCAHCIYGPAAYTDFPSMEELW